MDKSGGWTVGTDAQREIYVYSNAKKVKLSVLNESGETLWSQENSAIQEKTAGNLAHPPFFFENVPYTSDSYLKAEEYDEQGKVIAEQEVHTAKKPVKILLEADDSGIHLTADGSDKVMVYATIVDADGNVCQDADNLLTFSVEGDARIVGDGDKRVGANPVQASAGMTGIYVEAGKEAGTIKVTAKADGLETASVEIVSHDLEAKCVPYEEIARGIPMDQKSMYLIEKEETIPGEDVPSVGKGTITVDGQDYVNSMEVKNAAPVQDDLKGNYRQLTGKIGLKNPDATNTGVVFKVYGDGSLLYRSEPITTGTTEIDVDISGVKTLTLVAISENEINKVVPCWLSPYVTEGQESVDESELRENLASGAQVSATSTDEGTTAEEAEDGDVLTLWRSKNKVTEENPEALTVDLGQTCDIRNARIAVEFDYLKCTYTIYTSVDGKIWEAKSTSSKTAHANAEIDKFTAEGVRYVKVEFTKVESTHGETGGSEQKASVKEFEIYKDKGVETVVDYNLAGISVAGQDIVFSQYQTEYPLTLSGNEKEFWIKAFPANPDSRVTINGETADTENAGTMEDMAYRKAVPNEHGVITIEVTSPDGNAVKQYLLKVISEDDRKSVYEAWNNFVPGVNGANGWFYQVMDRNSKEITDLEDRAGGFIAGEYAWSGGSGWLYAGPRYMHPASDRNAVRTFVTPKDGCIALTALAEKYQNQWGGVDLWIQKNGEKIWPSDSDKKYLDEGSVVRIYTAIEVKKDDKIQIVLDSQGENGGDATFIDSQVQYLAEDVRKGITYLSDMEWESAEAGYGSVNRDRASDGEAIALSDEEQNPVVYKKGIGTHATSRIVYNVKDAGFTGFESYVGVDYSQNPGGYYANLTFKVYFNDESTEPVFDSGVMTYNTPQKLVKLALDETVEKLILVVEEGENNYSDHADWADAKLIKGVESISFDNEADSITIKEESKLKVTVDPADAADRITWSSSDEEVLTVDSDGNIKALWPGEAVVTVKAGDKSASIKITVYGVEKIYDNVKKDDWFYDAANWAYVNEVMSGYENNTFGPSDTLVRAHFAAILYRVASGPEVEFENRFPDVTENDWFADAAIWANDNGVITGYADSGMFGPADNITREQIATILYRYAKAEGYDVKTSGDLADFPDADKVSGFAQDAMKWVVATGIIKGDKGKLNPQGNANRAEAATVIKRFCEAYEK